MKKIIIAIIIIILLIMPVNAASFEVPTVPESGSTYMPKDNSSFSEDLIYVVKHALEDVRPDIAAAVKLCIRILSVTMLTAVVKTFSSGIVQTTSLIGSAVIGTVMLTSVNTMTNLGSATIYELSEYGKMLLPVMTSAMAARGSVNASTTLYVGTAIFSTVLTSLISRLLIPMLYLFVCCCIAGSALGEELLKRTAGFFKWAITWSLKIILYVFSGYMTITGVISGSADATAIKAAKLTISGAVPVVGNILADASETILLSADIMKNAAGTYGLIAFSAILIGPFLKVLVQYIMLKITAAVSEVFNTKHITSLINDFSSAMGFVLAMTGSVCLLLMISIVCFMKGVA